MHLLVDGRTVDDYFPGIGRWTYETINALLDEDVRLTVVLSKRSQTQFDLQPIECRAQVVWSDAAIFGLQQMHEFPRIARRAKVDAALFPYYVRPWWMPCSSVTVIHDTISWRVPELYTPLKRSQIRWMHHLALGASSMIATDSRASAADIVQFYSVDPLKLVVVYAGASAAFQPQPQAAIAELQQRLGIPGAYLLFLASDKPHKNMRFLIEAWQAAETGTTTLVCAGRWRDPATEALITKLRPADRVLFLRDVDEQDLPTLYSGAQAFVFPSRYEGFGLPALEALACGTPVVAAATSCLPEIVGQAGLLLPLERQTWIEALERVCHEQTWAAHLPIDPQTQAQLFTWQRTAQALCTTFRKLI